MGATGYIIKSNGGRGGEARKEVVVSAADGTIDVEKVETFDKVDFRIKTTYDGYEIISVGSLASGGYFKAAHIKFNEENRRYRLVCILNGGSYTPVAKDFAIYYIKFGWRTGGVNADHWYIEEYSRQGNGAYVSLEQIALNEYNVLIHTPTGYAYANIGILKEDKEPDVTIDHFNNNTTRYTPTGTIIETETPAWKNGAFVDTNPEDLAIRNGLLQLADRSSIDGLGYVILRPDKTFAEQVTLSNCIYEVRYNFDLGGGGVTIPTGCTLSFVGGSISNGTLNLTDTIISGTPSHAIRTAISGTIANAEVYVDWFTSGAGDEDCTNIIQALINVCQSTIVFTSSYRVQGGIIVLKSNTHLFSENKATLFSDGNVHYVSMLRGNETGSNNVTIEGLVFDQRDELDMPASQLNDIKLNCINSSQINGLVVKDCEFYHCGNSAVVTTDNTGNNIQIVGNTFVYYQLQNTGRFDNSTIYCRSSNHVIKNNYIRAAENSLIGGGIETHSNVGIVEGNRIEGCRNAINVCGGVDATDTYAKIISGNIARGCSNFVKLWPYDSREPIKNLLIQNNNAVGLRSAISSEILATATQSIENVVVQNNYFEGTYSYFASETELIPNTDNVYPCFAVYLPSRSTMNLLFRNNVFNSFAAGLIFTNMWGSMADHYPVVEFAENECINCVNSGIAVHSAYYSLFQCGMNTSLNIHNNVIELSTNDRGSAIYLCQCHGAGIVSLKIIDNTFKGLNPVGIRAGDINLDKIVTDCDNFDFNNQTTSYTIQEIPRHLRVGDVIVSTNNVTVSANGSYGDFGTPIPVLAKFLANGYVYFEMVNALEHFRSGDIIHTTSETSSFNNKDLNVVLVTSGVVYVKKLNQTEFADSISINVSIKEAELVKREGDTTLRPILTSTDAGFQYFDTDIGKPIYWTGSKWVDANGNDLQ